MAYRPSDVQGGQLGVAHASATCLTHDYVVFASLKDVDVPAEDVIILAATTFSYHLVAADAFAMSQQVGLAFTSAAAASDALTTGLVHDETVIPLVHRADHRPDLKKLTISGVNCTSPKLACAQLVQYFSAYGTVVDVTPVFGPTRRSTTGCGT